MVSTRWGRSAHSESRDRLVTANIWRQSDFPENPKVVKSEKEDMDKNKNDDENATVDNSDSKEEDKKKTEENVDANNDNANDVSNEASNVFSVTKNNVNIFK